jgi:tetratricopeptide (TPR) repeat protein
LAEIRARQAAAEEAVLLLRRALQLWQLALGPEHVRVGQAWLQCAQALRQMAAAAECRQALARARRILTRAWGAHDSRLAPLLRLWGEVQAEAPGDAEPLPASPWEQALQLLAPADAAAADADAADGFELAQLWRLRAQDARARQQPELAQECDQQARQACAGLWPGESPAAEDASDPGAGEQSEAVFRNAVAIWEKALGPDHPHVATSLVHLARVCAGQGKFSEAEPLLLRAFDIRQRLLGPQHPLVAESCHDLGGVCQQMGRWEEAERWCRQALEIWGKNPN